MNSSKFSIGVESTLAKVHFFRWTQIQKISFLWLKYTYQEEIARNG